MAHIGGKRHLRRISAPKTWPIYRKGSYWVARPLTTGIPFELCMPIILWLRDYLKLVKNKRELRYILSKGSIEVNGKKVKDISYPVGLFDTMKVVDINKYYRVSVDLKGKLKLVEIPEEEYGKKIIRIIRKQNIKGGKIQITGFDGKNFIIDENNVRTEDSIFINLINGKIEKVIGMEPGMLVFFYKGNSAGRLGRIKEIKVLKRSFGHTRFIVYEDLETGESRETLSEFSIVVGKDKPLITL